MDAIPSDLRYTSSDEWVRREGDEMIVGITAYAAEQLGDVVYVELPDRDKQLAKDEAFGEIESVKAVSDLNSPLSGVVIEVNQELDQNPALVNDDPYGQGWLVRVRADNPDEYADLLGADEYERKTLEPH